MIQSFLHAFTPQGFIVLLLTITVLVAAHEYGHYLFAKLFGMGVEEFAIGFGRNPIWTYRRKTYRLKVAPDAVIEPYSESSASGMPGEMTRRTIIPVIVESPEGRYIEETTNFTIRPWPLGGFVRIKGMMPEDDGSEVRIPGGFYSKDPWKRFIVLLAGPVFSVLAGVIMLAGLYSTQGVVHYKSDPVISEVRKPSPADSAGLKAGDRILAINGTKIGTFYQIVRNVRNAAGQHLTIEYSRAGKNFTTTLIPQQMNDPTPVMDQDFQPTEVLQKQALVGILPQHYEVRESLMAAIGKAMDTPVSAVQMIGGLFKQPSLLKNAVGGPLTMLQAASDAASGGIGDDIALAALLSISVGIFNLLPVPPLDGGQMAIALAEMFRRGRRLSMRVQNTVAAAGMALVLTLVVFVLFIDFQRIGGPHDQLKATPPQAAKTK